MAETYCGKSCAECAQKETMNCPGCKAGPGRQFAGDCELAKCVRSKGHETCETCGFRGNCGTLRGREGVPELRRRKLALLEEEKAVAARRAPVLGRWIWILFWLFIPGEIASIMSNDTVTQWLPGLLLPGRILGAAVNIGYALILMKLAAEEERYRKAGIFSLIAWGLNLLATVIAGPAESSWTLLLTLPAGIIALIGEYNEYMAHSAVLTGVNRELSENWENLWKWYMGSFAVMIGSVVILLIIPILGALIVVASALAVLVVGIMKIVYLYRTAKAFREFDSAK